MSPKHHDSPYADEPSSSRHSTPEPSRPPRRGSSRGSSANGNGRSHPNGGTKSPRLALASHPAKGNGHAASGNNGGGTSGRKRRRRSKGVYRQSDELTSHPTTRNAYVGTREWLLAQHGPVCAYCGTRWAAEKMTLDHVAPRRGQTAYDRRDNLVLACQPCNAAKRDLAPLAFLLGNRNRARYLVRYGEHLSSGLLELARSLLPAGVDPDEDSPYKD